TELGARPAGPILGPVQPDDHDRVAARYLDRAVGRAAVGQDDLAVDFAERGDRALDCGCDVLLFVQRLDDDADGRLLLRQHCTESVAAARRCATGPIATARARLALSRSRSIGLQHAFAPRIVFARSHAGDWISEARMDGPIDPIHLAAQRR